MNDGDFLQVMCTVREGDLPINITWFLNHKKLDKFPEITVSAAGKRGSTLSVESLTHAHAGIYTCKATNKAGEAEYNAELKVNGSNYF